MHQDLFFEDKQHCLMMMYLYYFNTRENILKE